MKQLAVRKIDEKEEARYDMKVPEKIGIDLYVFEKLRQKVTRKRDPVVGAGRGKVGKVDAGLSDLRVGDPVGRDKKAGEFEEKDEKE